MKKRLLNFLRCPRDKSELKLVVWKSKPATHTHTHTVKNQAKNLQIDYSEIEDEIQEGLLLNQKSKIIYPIVDGVPRMLVFETDVAKQFREKHRVRLDKEYPDYNFPNFQSAPGESEVLRTFSSEWEDYDWDGETYWNVTPEAMYGSLKFMLDLENRPVKGQQVLEVGIGCGGMANSLCNDQGCEMVGVDLGYSVDVAYKHFGSNPFLHIVQASVFALPFEDNRFDLAYSFGVLHHTYSTKDAFEKLAKMPKKKGGRAFVWVYSPENERRNLLRRFQMGVEHIVRPVLSRLPNAAQTVALSPAVPFYMLSQNIFQRKDGPDYVKYGVREAYHAARDRLTPRYIHRHTKEEVSSWFRESGFENLQIFDLENKPKDVPINFVTNAAVQGIYA